MNQTVAEILTLFRTKGGSQYGGEAVSQLEHALQCASLARAEGAADALITAALLHDVGHLLHDLPDDAPDQGVDDLHENLAANYLKLYFGDDVVEPARMHVEAKRYLSRVEPGYKERLSEPSIQSLALQGGPMDAEDAAAFAALPFAQDAVRLRRWDDQGKDPDWITEPIEAFADSIEASLGAV